MRVTHPFHPLAGAEFDLAFHRHNWGEDRVYFFDERGVLRGIPAAWTDRAAPDPFVVMAAGRCPFRVADLVALADLVERLGQRGTVDV